MSGLYEIHTLSDLQEMRNHLNDRCVLMADIDATETKDWNPSGGIFEGFEPIPVFYGSIVGNGYTISNLHIDRREAVYFMTRIENKATLITNGTFAGNADGWTLGDGWAYVSNNVQKNADGEGTLTQISGDMIDPLVELETYRLSFKLTSFTAGSVTVSIAGVEIGTYTSASTPTVEFEAASLDALTFTPSNDARFTLANVILVRQNFAENFNIRNASINKFRSTTVGHLDAAIFVGYIIGTSVLDSKISIDNIHVTGNINSDDRATGAPFSRTIIGADVNNCSANATMVMASGSGFCSNAGSRSTFTNCESHGSLRTIRNSFAGHKYVGGFSGISTGATFERCRSSVSIIHTSYTPASSDNTQIGGFMGAGGDATLCIATGNIIVFGNDRYQIGGFIGGLGGTITKCYATGSILCNVSLTSTSYIGGFFGYAGGTISNCYAQGDVCKTGISGTVQVGGFGGRVGSLSNCYSTGFVGGANAISGGFAGTRSGTQTSCRFDKETSGKESGAATGETTTGITGHTTIEMKTRETFVGWDFDDIWEIRQFERGAVGASNLTTWLSRVGDYDRFDAGVKDNDSFELMVPTANDIRWLGALESLLLGTAGDEWLIGSNKLETPLSPTNFKVKQQSEYGSSRIQPIKINSSLMFVDFVARKLREMTFVDPKYESPDLTALAEHITLHGITTIARQKNPDSIIWCTLGDGSLISMTYEREQDVVAWVKHPIDGFVQSVAVLPGTTEDTVYLSVERTINGADKVYLEKLASRVFETKADCHFADCGITVSVDDDDEIAGLEHLAGEKVAVLADGVVIYDGTEDESAVSELGVLTLPETITAAKVHVGLPYLSKLQPMRIIVGDSMGSHVRVAELVISLYNTGALKYGVNENNLIDVDLNDVRWNNTCKIKGLFTGEVVVSVPGGFDPLVPIFIVSDAPLPLTVRAIVPRVERTGR